MHHVYWIYDLLTNFVDNIFERAWTHILDTVKMFQAIISNTNNSIYY